MYLRTPPPLCIEPIYYKNDSVLFLYSIVYPTDKEMIVVMLTVIVLLCLYKHKEYFILIIHIHRTPVLGHKFLQFFSMIFYFLPILAISLQVLSSVWSLHML